MICTVIASFTEAHNFGTICLHRSENLERYLHSRSVLEFGYWQTLINSWTKTTIVIIYNMQSLCKKVDYLLICALPNKSINQSIIFFTNTCHLDIKSMTNRTNSHQNGLLQHQVSFLSILVPLHQSYRSLKSKSFLKWLIVSPFQHDQIFLN